MSKALLLRSAAAMAVASSLALSSGATVVSAAVAAEGYYQTKTPYQPQQDAATYEAVPAGYSPVYTEMVARHGTRGLSSPKYDFAIYAMWNQAEAEGALTDLGKQLGPDVMKIMKANFLLGYGVAGIGKPGYGNETAVGIAEHTALAQRVLARLPDLWQGVVAGAKPRQVVVVTSGVDRAVDSCAFFVKSLVATDPALAKAIVSPPAPGPYPAAKPVAQPAGTNHFLLYFHKLVPATDQVADQTDPLFRTYQASLDYQAYMNDPTVVAKSNAALSDPAVKAAAQDVMARLFTQPFLDKIANGTTSFTNAGSYTFTSDDGKFSSTLTGDGKTTIKSLVDAADTLYELYVIGPAMTAEAPGVDLTQYMPAADAKEFAYVDDTSDFYIKGPGIAEKGDATYKMAQILEDDFFNEVDAVEKGDLSHAAKFRFTHAEIMIPFAAIMGLKGMSDPVPQAATYTCDSDAWRGENVSPMDANMQWDVYSDSKGGLLVKMLYDEKESDFKAACDGAKIAPTSHFYDYQKLAACYGHVAKS